MIEEASELRAKEAGSKGLFRGGLFGMVGVSLMAVLWVGGSHVGDGSMTVSEPRHVTSPNQNPVTCERGIYVESALCTFVRGFLL